MSKRVILMVFLLSLSLLTVGFCRAASIGDLIEDVDSAREPEEPVPEETVITVPDSDKYKTAKDGILNGTILGFDRNMLFSFHHAEDRGNDDFLLIGFEGSGMNPRSEESACIIRNEALKPYNVIDFTVANEISYWQKKESAKAAEVYSTVVMNTIHEKFDGIKTVGIYAFSKGSSGVDCVFAKLRKEGFRVAFIWLNDSFAVNGISNVIIALLNNEITLYNRYSNSKRLNPQSMEFDQLYADRPNVDSRHVGTSHGGLTKYETFTEELVAAIEKAIDENR